MALPSQSHRRTLRYAGSSISGRRSRETPATWWWWMAMVRPAGARLPRYARKAPPCIKACHGQPSPRGTRLPAPSRAGAVHVQPEDDRLGPWRAVDCDLRQRRQVRPPSLPFRFSLSLLFLSLSSLSLSPSLNPLPCPVYARPNSACRFVTAAALPSTCGVLQVRHGVCCRGDRAPRAL